MNSFNGASLEDQIDQWRQFLRRKQAISATDVEELEGHLRDQVAELEATGLATDEAFLVAVKRMGNLDAISREFAREHSDRLWKQLVISEEGTGAIAASRREVWVAIGVAVAAALATRVPHLLGYDVETYEAFYARNMSLFVLPLLAGYFVWKRGMDLSRAWKLFAWFVLAAVVANMYPFPAESHTQILLVLHLPIALWLLIGYAYTGGQWFGGSGRMNFIRFSGELFIYFVLLALGGGVLIAFTLMMFQAIGYDVEWLAEDWIVPCGAAGAIIIASFLVEAKQSVIENMAPVLTRIFTPLFTIVLLVFLATMIGTGRGIDVQREVLIGFDLLLVVVLGLHLYSLSARDAEAPPGLFDRLQLVLVASALIVDLLALAAIASRISEFGFTPNRVAALGENVILLVNLTWSAWLYFRFVRGQGTFARLERWQESYLPVYAIWAAFVVVAFPLIFRFA